AVPDVSGDVVKAAGLSKEDLGFRGKGTWARWPRPPYKLPFFDDLLADATGTDELARPMGKAAERARPPPEEASPEGASPRATVLGPARRIGGFRGLGIGLPDAAAPAGDKPLEE